MSNKPARLLAGLLLASTCATLTVATRAQSAPFAWGYNSLGQLGNNSSANSSTPQPVDLTGALAGKTVTAMAMGFYHSVALCSDGTVATWGGNNFGQLGNNGVTGNSAPPSLVPVAVNTDSGVSALFGKTVVAVAAAYSTTLALCSDGTLATWGSLNFDGNLPQVESAVPVAVDMTGALAGKTVTQIAAGSEHFLVLCSDGSMAAWGQNSLGQLGNNSVAVSNVPVSVAAAGTALAGKTVVAIAAGGGFPGPNGQRGHNLALCADGTLVGWGSGGNGELGNNSQNNVNPLAIPVYVGPGSALQGKTVVKIAAGGGHSLALCSDNTLATWGTYNLFGTGINAGGVIPVAVDTAGSALAGKTVTAIAGGYCYSFALCSDGTLASWGRNNEGQLGDGSLISQTLPVAVVSNQSFTDVFGGAFTLHALALASPCAPASMSIAQYAGITVTGTIGCVYEIQYTTSLTPPVAWTTLTTVTLTSISYLHIDTTVPSGGRFYRVVSH